MSMGEAFAWYSTAAAVPPLGVRVKVLWDGRLFEAARVVRPGKKYETCWVTHQAGAAVFLPLDADERVAAARRTFREESPKPWAGYHGLGVETDDPDAWRPANPQAWKLPLPPVAFTWDEAAPPRLWAERQSFDAVDAALMAAEMEGDRDALRFGASDSRSGSRPEAPPEAQWWLDPHQITYSPPGSITPREAEGRLMRAFIAERWVHLDTPGWLSEDGDEDAGPAARIEPTGKDQDDMLTALGWMRDLPEGEGHERVLRERAQTPALTWRRIGQLRRLSHEGARQLHREALALVTNAANGVLSPHARANRARLEAVREANRRHKREGAVG